MDFYTSIAILAAYLFVLLCPSTGHKVFSVKYRLQRSLSADAQMKSAIMERAFMKL